MSYAYWRKCDLQVHSPRDPNWTGLRPVGIPESCIRQVDANRLRWANEFIDQCAARQLKAVAFTDHHEMIMVPYVQKAIEERMNCDPDFDLWFFPGMEITARGGKQCIIIFDADLSEDWRKQAQGKLGILFADIQEKQAIASPVTQLDVSYPEIACLLDELEDLRGRYIVLPNVSQGGSHTVLTHGGHKDFLNMPYVGGYLDKGQTIDTLHQRNKSRLSGEISKWSRRSIYPLPTSDSRSAAFSKLGTNDTWIKIAEPTAEAIRQAFLASQSRIRIEEPKLPSFVITKARVEHSTILETTILPFSPEFNAVIGGRGSGKSTFLEYVAYALGRSCHDIPRDHYSGTKRMQALIELFRSNDGCISLDVQMDNSPFWIVRGQNTKFQPQITYNDGTVETVTVEELRRLFPAVVYSQGELAGFGGGDASKTQLSDLLQFVDPDYKQSDDQFDARIRRAKAAVRSAIQAVIDDWECQSSLRKLQTKVASLKQRAEALDKTLPNRSEEDETILTHFNNVNEFNTKVSQASKHSDQILQDLKSDFSELRSKRNVSAPVDAVAAKVQQSYRDLYNVFVSGMTTLLDDLTAKRATLLTHESEWKLSYDDALSRRNSVMEKFGNQQAVTRQIIKLREEINRYENQIADLKQNMKASGDPSDQLDAELTRLRRITDERNQRTQEWAESIESLSNGKIKASVRGAADIEEIREAIDAIAAKTGSYEATRSRELVQGLRDQSASELVERLRSDCFGLLKWRQMQASYGVERPQCNSLMKMLGDTKSIRDSVTRLMNATRLEAIATAVAKPAIALHYCDGVREISFDKASDGQRAAALLFMLLEQPNGPLIIDQPEGDLDNRIITELTEKLHHAKEKRQLVFSSHNANLVVNGSAELVGQLDVNDAGERQFACTGAIDRPEVCEVITSTMEGGEKAFRDRQEKYGY